MSKMVVSTHCKPLGYIIILYNAPLFDVKPTRYKSVNLGKLYHIAYPLRLELHLYVEVHTCLNVT